MIRLGGILFILSVSLTSFSYAAGGGTSGNSRPPAISQNNSAQPQESYEVLPFESYSEEPSLPPGLKITFQLRCFQQFLKVVRHEYLDQVTGVTTISLGALVREDLMNPCESAQDMTVDAGYAYSGRKFEVLPIH